MSSACLALPYTINFFFPDTGGKFSAASMICRNDPAKDPLAIQQKQMRLSLVVTPVITARDDRGNKIVASTLHKALVLCMP